MVAPEEVAKPIVFGPDPHEPITVVSDVQAPYVGQVEPDSGDVAAETSGPVTISVPIACATPAL